MLEKTVIIIIFIRNTVFAILNEINNLKTIKTIHFVMLAKLVFKDHETQKSKLCHYLDIFKHLIILNFIFQNSRKDYLKGS